MARSNRNKGDLIDDFVVEYEAAMAEARKAAETTATPAWQKLYTDFIELNQKSRDMAAVRLEELATGLRAKPLDADSLKELRESAKSATLASESAMCFDSQTVAPIRGTVEELARIIAEYEHEAMFAASRAPLTDSELPDRLADVIAHQAKASWNPRIGCVTASLSRSVS